MLQDPHGELEHQNVLFVEETWATTAEKFGVGEDQIKQIIEECRRMLFHIRENRPRPHLDDKMIASWNGLMLTGLCKAAQVSFIKV